VYIPAFVAIEDAIEDAGFGGLVYDIEGMTDAVDTLEEDDVVSAVKIENYHTALADYKADPSDEKAKELVNKYFADILIRILSNLKSYIRGGNRWI